MLLVVYAVCTLVACGQGNSGAATPAAQPVKTTVAQPTATKPTIPAGTVLYRADWTHGLSGWQVGPGWKVEQGVLVTNTDPASNLVAPYIPPVADYAIEVSMQVVRVLRSGSGSFMIFAEDAPGKDGYQGGVEDLAEPPPSENPGPYAYAGFAQVIADAYNPNGPFESIDYTPGPNYRTYRIEVRGDEVKLFINGTMASQSMTTKAVISNGPLGLTATAIELRVKSFVISAL